jgi:NitT/TauT family transport system substrate-binding protein
MSTRDVEYREIQTHRRAPRVLAALAAVALLVSACGDDDAESGAAATSPAEDTGATPSPGDTTATGSDDTSAATTGAGTGSDDTSAATTGAGTDATTAVSGTDSEASGTLRLGYFANVTHAPAVIGEEAGLFAEALGDGVEIEYTYFNSGTEAIEALFAGAIDASFIGPNPAINGFSESNGEALRIVSGTTSGGASLVVNEEITSAEQLEGTTLATPSLGNTQDVALRAWLLEQGFEAPVEGSGDVSILPQDNADTLTAFQQGAIDGAWVPEPWATRLVNEGGGHVLLDERDIWPDGDFVTTHVIVDTGYLEENPAIVKGLISGLLDAIDLATNDTAQAQELTNAGIERVTTAAVPQEVISGAWEKMRFTPDPIASSLEKSKGDAVAVGLLDDVDLSGIYDLTLLNEVLAERGDEPIAAP